MKKMLTKRGIRYFLVFLLALFCVGAWQRFVPSDDPEGGNLLVNSVMALIITTLYVVVEKLVCKFGKSNKTN